ncbi:glycosyltransferase [Candidatus Woesearchaeota archaeon]|nr:glycosyltransferase [Candidatus Woesearchaeota archaeon]
MITFMDIAIWTTYIVSLYFTIFWFLVFLDGGAPDLKKKKIKAFPLVTIAIPVWNEEKTIGETLKSLLMLDYPKEKLEILIVNDASTDKTKEIVESIIKKNPDYDIKLVNNKEGGRGKAYPMNQMLDMAKGEYFVNFDADSKLTDKKTLKKLLNKFTTEDVGAVLPCMKVWSPQSFWEKVQHYEFLMYMFYKRLFGKLDCVHVCPGPFSVYNTEIIRKIGGFDTKNITEDMELTFRLQKFGYKVIQALNPIVYTKMADTLKGVRRQRNRWFKGTILTLIKHRDMCLNRKYGDFGMVMYPMVALSCVVATVMLVATAYLWLKPNVLFMRDMYFVGFDFMTLLKHLTFNFSFYDLEIGTILTAVIILGVTFLFIIKALQHIAGEKLLSKGTIPFGFFLFLYFLVIAFIWLEVTVQLLRGKVQKW